MRAKIFHVCCITTVFFSLIFLTSCTGSQVEKETEPPGGEVRARENRLEKEDDRALQVRGVFDQAGRTGGKEGMRLSNGVCPIRDEETGGEVNRAGSRKQGGHSDKEVSHPLIQAGRVVGVLHGTEGAVRGRSKEDDLSNLVEKEQAEDEMAHLVDRDAEPSGRVDRPLPSEGPHVEPGRPLLQEVKQGTEREEQAEDVEQLDSRGDEDMENNLKDRVHGEPGIRPASCA